MKAHVERVKPPGVTATVQHLHGGAPWRAELDGPRARARPAAAYDREPVSPVRVVDPVVGDFQRILKAPVLLVGCRGKCARAE